MSELSIARTITLWCPDWPVHAAAADAGLADDVPIALIDKSLVFACSASARAQGVRRGLRMREAQARCPELVVMPYDPALDIRSFEPVLAAIELIMPGVTPVRPGTCALRSRGPSRYYGSETAAADALLACVRDHGILGGRVGIADGPFASQQAAHDARPHRPVVIVPIGESPVFLAPRPISVLGSPDLVALLRRMGVQTLGDFAALDSSHVRNRFGAEGAILHSLAAGDDARTVVPRAPVKELDRVIEFEPPVDRIDQVTFAFRATAGVFIERLTEARLVATAIRIEVDDETGGRSERTWVHPRVFTEADVVDRVRWQLQGDGAPDSGLRSPIVRVRVVPESTDAIGNHEDGLWGGADERVHHGLSRVQSMLGHEAVVTPAIGGGRSPAERRTFVPWGERPVATAERPWPGSLPSPVPTTVFESPLPVLVLTAQGDPLAVDERGSLTGSLAQFSPSGRRGDAEPVSAWAGPWPVVERWWDAQKSRALTRFQVIDATGTAWLLLLDDEGWHAEARYD